MVNCASTRSERMFFLPPAMAKPELLIFYISLIRIIADYNDYQRFVKGGGRQSGDQALGRSGAQPTDIQVPRRLST